MKEFSVLLGFSNIHQVILTCLVSVFGLLTALNLVKIAFTNFDEKLPFVNTFKEVLSMSLLVFQFWAFVKMTLGIQFDYTMVSALVCVFLFGLSCIVYEMVSDKNRKQAQLFMIVGGCSLAISLVIRFLHKVPG